MTNPEEAVDPLEARARAGDAEAMGELFTRWRRRLELMVKVRMDPRLAGRFDPSDVLQEAWLDVARRLQEYAANPEMPAWLWVRFLTVQKLAELHRRHLGAQRRDAGREVRRMAGPGATSVSIASRLVGDATSPSRGAEREEMRERLTKALDSMDEIDREVLLLRHFEELTNNEVAAVLGITKAGASNRYVRALARLSAILGEEPGGAP